MAGCYSSLLVDEWQHFKSCVLCSVDCWALMYSFCGVACGAYWCNCLTMRTREKGKRKEENDPHDDSDLFMLLFCLMCFDVLILLVVVLLVVVFVLY